MQQGSAESVQHGPAPVAPHSRWAAEEAMRSPSQTAGGHLAGHPQPVLQPQSMHRVASKDLVPLQRSHEPEDADQRPDLLA